MTNPLLTTSEVQAGDLLATVDGTEFYCSGADWSSTPPAIHARYQAQIDRLEDELAAARAALVDVKSTPDAVEDAPVGVPCPYCPKVCQDRRGLAAHIRIKHASEK